MKHNIGSGADYAKLIIDEIKSIDEPNENVKNVWPYLFELIKEKAHLNWHFYLLGSRESYMFSDSELQELWDKASLDYLQTEINGLVDKGMLVAGINEEGEVVYSITEEGKKNLEWGQ